MTDRPPTPQRSQAIGWLVGVNVALALLLGAAVLAPQAIAQQGTQRPRGQFIVLGGEINTGQADAAYIVDTANQDMVVVRFGGGNQGLEGIGYRDLTADQNTEIGR